MKKRYTLYFIAAVLAFMAIIAVIVTLLFSKFESTIITYVQTWGLISILVISFISDLLVQPIGPDIPIVAGLIVGLNPVFVFVMAATGSFLASLISFSVGRAVEDSGIKNPYYDKYFDKFWKFFKKHGKLTLTIAAVTPIPYVPFCWFSGMFKMKIIDFVIFGILPRTLRFLGVVFLTWNIIRLT